MYKSLPVFTVKLERNKADGKYYSCSYWLCQFCNVWTWRCIIYSVSGLDKSFHFVTIHCDVKIFIVFHFARDFRKTENWIFTSPLVGHIFFLIKSFTLDQNIIGFVKSVLYIISIRYLIAFLFCFLLLLLFGCFCYCFLVCLVFVFLVLCFLLVWFFILFHFFFFFFFLGGGGGRIAFYIWYYFFQQAIFFSFFSQ